MYYQTDMDMWTLIDTHTMCIQKMTQGRLFHHAYACILLCFWILQCKECCHTNLKTNWITNQWHKHWKLASAVKHSPSGWYEIYQPEFDLPIVTGHEIHFWSSQCHSVSCHKKYGFKAMTDKAIILPLCGVSVSLSVITIHILWAIQYSSSTADYTQKASVSRVTRFGFRSSLGLYLESVCTA